MDRPEDVQRNPVTGAVYVMCTNNSQREDPNDPNPRAPNFYGHVIEIMEDGNDPTETSFSWTIPLAGGEPGVPYEEGGLYTIYEDGEIAAISSPDNCTFDNDGNLWIATDGTSPITIPVPEGDPVPANDGFFSMPVSGRDRGNLQLFATVPRGRGDVWPGVHAGQPHAVPGSAAPRRPLARRRQRRLRPPRCGDDLEDRRRRPAHRQVARRFRRGPRATARRPLRVSGKRARHIGVGAHGARGI